VSRSAIATTVTRVCALTSTHSKSSNVVPLLALIQALLQSFFGLLTQPFEQSPTDAVKGAATGIALGVAFAVIGENDILSFATNSLALVIIWMLGSAVFASADLRTLQIAHNVGVISFWIAGTSALVLLAEQVYPDPISRVSRMEVVSLGLALLIPVHMFRSLRVLAAVAMILALWASTGFLAYRLLY